MLARVDPEGPVPEGRAHGGDRQAGLPTWFVSNNPANGKGYESAVAYAVAGQLGFSKTQVHWAYEPFNNSLIATHEMGFARDIADRVCFLEDGVIVEDAPPEQLLQSPKDPRTQRFLRRITDAGRL
ncbi:MAG TPA: hypothetical protein VG253_09080 [Streptosporangiaceae bacterium]|nr:hypothetical protein [Streptosporangiaceae bacterium]